MITRYTLGTSYASGAGIPGIVESPQGEYVRYADRLESLHEAHRQIAALTEDYADMAAKNAELERQLEAIGAGGVSPLMGSQIDRQGWYGIDYSGDGGVLMNAPQPANPAIKESLTVAEPVKVPSVPDGWKLVPVEPTREMVLAGKRTIKGADTTFEGILAAAAYSSMLAAAPTPPADRQNPHRQGRSAQCDKRGEDGWALYCVECSGKAADGQAQQDAEKVGAQPDWNNREIKTLAGWVNELGTLSQHHGAVPGWLRNALIVIYRGLMVASAQPDPAMAGDDLSLIEQLREYAADNGYSHNDYADTMRAAADVLERVQPVG